MDITLNKIKATVKNINNYDGVNIVEFDFNNIKLSMISLELSSKIQIGTSVILGVKPSHITLAKNLSGQISASNNFETTITNIEEGKLLAVVNMEVFDTHFESLITVNSVQRMNLKKGDNITVLIKAGELFIKELCND
jgi:molybdopterin-binding protein